MLERFSDKEKMQEILCQAQTGLWVIELEDGAPPRLYGDGAMMELLGLEEMPSPEECYEYWYGRIDPDYHAMVQKGVDKMIMDNRAEVQYPWVHPEWGKIYVRCGGLKDGSYTGGICLRGYHQNITDTIMLKQDYDAVIRTLSESYKGIFLWNLENGTYKVIKTPETLRFLLWDEELFEGFLRQYIQKEVAPDFRASVLAMSQREELKRRFFSGERRMECLYRNVHGGWRRIRLVPAKQFSQSYPWIIAAMDNQDSEADRQLDDASSQAAVSQIYQLVMSVDPERQEYNCIHYSGALLKLFRHGPFEAYGRQMLSRMPKEDQEIFYKIYNLDSYRENQYLDGTLRLWDQEGKLHYYDYYAACVRADLGQRILLTVRNIDDKRQGRMRENVLSNLCQCYYSIYLFDLEHGIEEAIWQEDEIHRRNEFPKGRLSHYYTKFVENYVFEEDREKMLRAGAREFLQKTLSEAHPVYDIDFRRCYPDGLQWVRSRFSVAEMRDGEVVKVIFANMNINSQKLKELEEEEHNRQALQAAYEAAKEANETKSNFLAQMSHDIRTPMNAILGMSAIAASHAEDPVKVKDCLDKIHISSNHLLSLINAILDMSKIEKGKLELNNEPFYIGDLLEQIESIIRSGASEKRLHIEFKNGGISHEYLWGDENRIRQALLNIIGNAVKYTPQGGIIRVTAQEVSWRSQDVACFVFTVEDNGIGISEEFLKYIYAPFTRAEEVRHIQGTGLGMSIAYGIVKAMEGDIRVESALGKGSRFTVTLYLKIADSSDGVRTRDGTHRAKDGKALDEISVEGLRILLAEDNELNREIAKTLLEESGLKVDEAENGKAALDVFAASQPETYDAIFMDIQMPVMDGYEAARRIRGCGHPQSGTIPIIALTANAFAQDIAKALMAGMNDHVQKPIDYERLLAVLRQNLT